MRKSAVRERDHNVARGCWHAASASRLCCAGGVLKDHSSRHSPLLQQAVAAASAAAAGRGAGAEVMNAACTWFEAWQHGTVMRALCQMPSIRRTAAGKTVVAYKTFDRWI